MNARAQALAGRVAAFPGAVTIIIPLILGVAGGQLLAPHMAPTAWPITTALTHGTLYCVGLLLIAVGAQVKISGLHRLAGRTALILAGATVLPALMILGYGWIWGAAGILGVPLLTLVSMGVSTSGGLWAEMTMRIGRLDEVAAGLLAAVANSGPLLPLVILVLWMGDSGTPLPYQLLLDSVAPLAAGMALGYLPGVRAALRPLVPVMIAGMSLGVGWSIPLPALGAQIPTGIALGIANGLLSAGTVGLLFRTVLHRPAALGIAAASPAAVSAAIPSLVILAVPTLTPHAQTATAQAGIAAITGTLLAAALTAWTRRPRPARVEARRPTDPHLTTINQTSPLTETRATRHAITARTQGDTA